MSAGSAASLPMPQGPLSPSSFARRPRFTVLPPDSGPLPLPRMLPAQKAVGDPPRARILIAWNDTEPALRLQRLLREFEYAVIGPAGGRDEFERLIAHPGLAQRPIDAALVHVGLPDAAAIADRLAAASVPLVWLAADRDAAPPTAHASAPILDRPFDPPALLAAIDEAERQRAGRRWYPTPPPQSVWPRIFPQL